MSEITSDESEPVDRALRDLIDAEHRREHLDERRRRHWLRHQIDESVSVIDVVRAVATQGSATQGSATKVDLTTGATVTTTINEIGADYLGVCERAPTMLLVHARAIVAVRTGPHRTHLGRSTGEELAGHGATRSFPETTFAERLCELARGGPCITVTLTATTIRGQLRRCGQELMVIEGPDGYEAFVAVPAILMVEVGP